MLVLHLLGYGWLAGFTLGGALAMSSTAIVSKMLAERMELSSPHGRDVMGTLLFQDLAVVAFLIAVPTVADGGSDTPGPSGHQGQTIGSFRSHKDTRRFVLEPRRGVGLVSMSRAQAAEGRADATQLAPRVEIAVPPLRPGDGCNDFA